MSSKPTRTNDRRRPSRRVVNGLPGNPTAHKHTSMAYTRRARRGHACRAGGPREPLTPPRLAKERRGPLPPRRRRDPPWAARSWPAPPVAAARRPSTGAIGLRERSHGSAAEPAQPGPGLSAPIRRFFPSGAASDRSNSVDCLVSACLRGSSDGERPASAGGAAAAPQGLLQPVGIALPIVRVADSRAARRAPRLAAPKRATPRLTHWEQTAAAMSSSELKAVGSSRFASYI